MRFGIGKKPKSLHVSIASSVGPGSPSISFTLPVDTGKVSEMVNATDPRLFSWVVAESAPEDMVIDKE